MTLADHLRALPDADLGAVLRARPDLLVPVPGTISDLAAKAQSRLSVARALEGLDQFTLEMLDAVRLAAHPTATVDAVVGLAVGAPADRVRQALDRLRALALVYGADGELRLVGTVEDLCSVYPAGLGRPAVELDAAAAELAGDPAALRRALLAAPAAARAVLDRLAEGPPVGTVRDAFRPAAPGEPESPVRWLITRRLLVPTAADTVELPREVGLLLRREHGPLGPLHPAPPEVAAPVRDIAAADSAGAGQAMEAVRLAEAVLAVLAAEPAAVLRAGGIGVRDLRRVARDAGVGERDAALLLEVTAAAGLLADTGDAEPQWLPTAAYDTWCAEPLAVRWGRLARAWLAMTRLAGLVGARDERGRPINALSGEVERIGAPGLRRTTLQVLRELPVGAAPPATDVIALLAWEAPRRGGSHRDEAVRATLAEAAVLGVTGLGALTGYGRALVAAADSPDHAAAGTSGSDDDPLGIAASPADTVGADDDVVVALEKLLPAPVDHVLVQADLTVVVPGPPELSLAAELALVADAESAGGATVYRVSPASVRRALDAGYSAGDIHKLFARRSRTGVPQSLQYLVDDVARRHGGLRTGTAGAYLRSDDTALLAEAVADRRLAPLALRALAPTVLVTPYGVHRLLAGLRDAGYAPVPEDATGALVVTSTDLRRAPVRPRRASPAVVPAVDETRLTEVVRSLRRGDAAARAARRAPVRTERVNDSSTSAALGVLQRAVQERLQVWVGYVDAHGSGTSRLLRPVSLGAGYLRAEDERSEMLHTFALHRITSATLAD